MRIADFFCGAGGCAHGYRLAGHQVFGFDNNPRLRGDYLASGASGFIAGDALDIMRRLIDSGRIRQFDFVHASPPCQRYSAMTSCRPGNRDNYPELITPFRELLIESGVPFCIENVEKAASYLKDPVALCGLMFKLPSYRHRLFEAGNGFTLAEPPSPPADIRAWALAAYAKFGDPAEPVWADKPKRVVKACGWPHPVKVARSGHYKAGCGMFSSPCGNEYAPASIVGLGIDWMDDRAARGEAVAPAMTRWLGEQIG